MAIIFAQIQFQISSSPHHRDNTRQQRTSIRLRGLTNDLDKMKKTLFLVLAAAVLFDLAAGSYLMHLLDARKTQRGEAKSDANKSPQTLPRADSRTSTRSKPGYSIY